MIILIFLAIFIFAGLLALRSLGDLKTPESSGVKIKRKEKKTLFGVIRPTAPHRHEASRP